MAPSILSRLSAEARQRIREHRAAGHTTILITGAVRTFTRPLRELFDVIVAAELGVDEDGRCTGFLTTPPLVGESRAAWLKHYAALHGVDLSRSFAYADSHSDLPMLQTVGQPVAVSPDISLMRAAQRSQWSMWMEDQADHPRWQIPADLKSRHFGDPSGTGQSLGNRDRSIVSRRRPSRHGRLSATRVGRRAPSAPADDRASTDRRRRSGGYRLIGSLHVRPLQMGDDQA